MNENDILRLNDNMITLDMEAYKRSEDKWNSLAKPLGSLGVPEEIIKRIAALKGDENVSFKKPVLYVCCADNGVIREGVSQSGADVTAAVAAALGKGVSTVNFMAEGTGCRVIPVDLGILDFPGAEGVTDMRVRNSTGNIAAEAAMSDEEACKAIENGIVLSKKAKDEGYDIVLTGEMGIGNTTTSSALSSVLLNKKPEEVTGRGAGLSDEGLEKKIKIIKKAISLHKSNNNSYINLLSKIGGLDIAAMAGICIGGGLYGIPVLLDGFISLTAALLAIKITPACKSALIASHTSAEPAAGMLLNGLGLKPMIDAGMRLGEGSGAVAALRLLQMAENVYNSRHTFEHLGIEAYKKL